MSQSQISQFSDNYPSSIFEDNPDSLSFLPSDGAQSFNPDALNSQTPISTPDINFAQPLPPPSIPNTLQRVGPKKQKMSQAMAWVLVIGNALNQKPKQGFWTPIIQPRN
ncbi:hypothetical protein BDW66DRAFT_154676 [Aspergillus desertorum]